MLNSQDNETLVRVGPGTAMGQLMRLYWIPFLASNPCLGEIGQPPFVALRILPADAASSSGLPIDADGRVLDRAGRVVVGLYACGNDAASVMRGTYPGPGTTLGPAFVFAWRAALFAARRAASARAHPIEEKP